jgi:hypothetical protein
MPPWVIDLIITILILGMTYALTSEGLCGAALTFFNVLFSALIALNFYEPLAQMLVDNASAMASYADVLCLGGLFLVTFIILKIVTEKIAPTMVRFPTPVYHIGRLVFGAGASIMAAAFLLLVFHVSPVDRHMFGVIDYNYKPPWGFGLDRKMLAFFQYSTGNTFPRYGSGLGQVGSEYGDTYVFDPRASWLPDHQNARPYPSDGSGMVIESETSEAPEAGPADQPDDAAAQAMPAEPMP